MRIELGHTLDLHVAMLQLPFVVGFEQHSSDQADDAVFVREDADDIGTALDLLVQALQRIRAVKFGAVLRRKGHVGKHVSFGVVHEGAELRPSGPELIGDMPPCLDGIVMIRLNERLADRSGNHGVLALGNVSERITHRMNPASLPCCAENTGNGGLQPLMSIGDDEFDASKATANQIAQEACPERLGFGRADV